MLLLDEMRPARVRRPFRRTGWAMSSFPAEVELLAVPMPHKCDPQRCDHLMARGAYRRNSES